MKRNNKITVNFNDDEYKKILLLSQQDRRSPSLYLYLLVIDEILKRMK